MGAASGGVWKSTDAGLTWEPIFEDHGQSIGAIRVDPQDPETVWVGTGEPAELSTDRDFATLNSQLRGRGLDELEVMTREAWEQEQERGGATTTTISPKILAGLLMAGPMLFGM